VTSPPETWEDRIASVHESAHACVARYFGMPIKLVTMDMVYIPHRPYAAPDCDNSIERLIVHAAGDAATSAFLCWTGTGITDDQLSRDRLRDLGAGFFQRRRLMREARGAAVCRVWSLKDEIYAVAQALRQRRTLTQSDIDCAIRDGSNP
jgi:hypothetical protein